MDKNNLPTAKSSLSKKLAQLNAAIADLLQALSGTNTACIYYIFAQLFVDKIWI